MKAILAALLASATFAAPVMAQTAAPIRADQAAFRALYQELVETNTVVGVGSCTQAAQQIKDRMRTAGYAEDRLTLYKTDAHPNDGGLVAVLPGSDARLKPMVLLAHIDVVAAKREDWTRDPFKLIEENGYFYGRGTLDDKSQAAIWADTMIRFATSGHRPKRTIKLALTCGEETSGAFNGAEYLTKERPDLIAAGFALNEGGGGRADGKGKLLVQTLQIGEKVYQDFTLTTTNPGGHSSQPVRDNAINVMADALSKIRDNAFPLEFNEVTRAFFAKAGAMRPDAGGQAMVALAANPADKAAEALVNQDKMLNSLLRTTCVATLIDGGHAQNALPQNVTANVNCRMLPGHSPDETQAVLAAAIGNPAVSITQKVRGKPLAKAPPMDPKILGPIERIAAKHFPGVPVVPAMSTGATDAVYFAGIGIPTYGVPGVWADPDLNGIHGLNERVEVKALYAGRDYLFDLVKELSSK